MPNIFESLLASLQQGAVDPNAAPPTYNMGGTLRNPVPTGPNFTPRMGATVANPGSAPVDPESLMSMMPQVSEMNQSVQPPGSAPLPVETKTSVPDVTKAPSVAAARKATQSSTAGNGGAAPDDDFAALLAQAARTPGHKGEREKLEADKNAALGKAEGEKQLTDEEKIATALISVLPGLVGAIGGGAAAGGYGAAAGAAGGLQGAAAGIQGIAATKEAHRKEFKGDADKLNERLIKLDADIAAEKEKAQDRTLSMSLQERSAKKAASLEQQKMAQQLTISREGNATQRQLSVVNNAAAMDRAILDATTQTQKALMTAKAQGGELKDFQAKASQFATSMLVASDELDKMKDPSVWNTMQTWSGLQSALADPKRQLYARAALNFIEPAIRDVSGAAFGPVEWETKVKQYLPMLGSSPQDIAAAKQYRDSALATMLAKAGPGRDIAIKSYLDVQPKAQTQTSGGEDDAQALAWARANPNDPRAAAILQFHK